jgi:hypothetical protein
LARRQCKRALCSHAPGSAGDSPPPRRSRWPHGGRIRWGRHWLARRRSLGSTGTSRTAVQSGLRYTTVNLPPEWYLTAARHCERTCEWYTGYSPEYLLRHVIRRTGSQNRIGKSQSVQSSGPDTCATEVAREGHGRDAQVLQERRVVRAAAQPPDTRGRQRGGAARQADAVIRRGGGGGRAAACPKQHYGKNRTTNQWKGR